MKILKWIEYQDEIDLSAEDISIFFKEDGNERVLLQNINSIAGFMIGVPNEMINKLSKSQKELDTFRLLIEEALKKVSELQGIHRSLTGRRYVPNIRLG